MEKWIRFTDGTFFGRAALKHRNARIFQTIGFSLVVAFVFCLIGEDTGIELLFFPALASVFVNFSFDERRDVRLCLAAEVLIIAGAEIYARHSVPWIFLLPAVKDSIEIGSWVAAVGMVTSQISSFYKAAEQSRRALDVSQAHTKAILETVGDSFYFVAPDWRLLYFNPTAAGYLAQHGISKAEGLDFWKLIPSENERGFAPMLKSAMQTGQPLRHEYYDEGQNLWMELRADPGTEGMSISFRNIDEQKRFVNAVTESEEIQRTVFERAATGLNILGPDGKFIRANPTMCQMLGYTEQDMIGKSFKDFTDPDDIDDSQLYLQRLKRGEFETFVKQKRYLHKSGRSILASLQTSVIRHPDGSVKLMISAVQDLTESKAAEQKLLYASKMSSLGEMAGSIAHEINNPMTIIQLNAEQLEEAARSGKIASERAIKAATRILSTVDRVTKIVRGLKSFSRNADQDPLVPTQVSTILEDSLALCGERFKNRNIALLLGELPPVEISCRATEISQVLLNLLANSFDAIEDGNLKERWVQIDAVTVGSSLQISISDSGPGIPPAVAARILEPFFSTKPIGKGTGLGLSISKGIIETHGGRFFLDQSKPNTCFVIEIPLRPSVPSNVLPIECEPSTVGIESDTRRHGRV